MFHSVINIVDALWHQNIDALTQTSMLSLYVCIGVIIWLESAFLPAAPLPCDSVIILSGSLAALGVIDLYTIIAVLTVAAWLGSLLAYYQGRQLQYWPRVRQWLTHVPEQHLTTTDRLLGKYGLVALFLARFLPVVRSLVPLVMGLREQNGYRIIHLAAISSALWIAILVLLGYSLKFLPESLSKPVTMLLMLAPLFTLAIGIISVTIGWWMKKRTRA
ncbi:MULTISPECIES: DedA family protein [unclassified Vibrio]|uniref:DedA family protein n=1 Tax=unclassified Vibrio TaxID=2614977 RepID=UPI001361789D|nr:MULTISPECIES: DedA family protein [unclassified Vibrio]NAW58794.1 DedA family protein [Vibrio sp. V36_P2S2PM302]NAX25417.1 DedA family protein [Vibrio sp. V38_P2S17PM301]NAX32169.1 DedA family protein [Vibrio sp. V37_P2S8PM304]